MAAGKFTRFSEKRDAVISDITTYDDAVDGIEPDESSGLHIPIAKDNVGFKLIQKMGWESGRGLGRNRQGRVDPVPLKLKDDFMGLGRFQHELDLAAETTDKRKQLEIEKDLTPDLIDKYKNQIQKEKSIADSTSDLRQSYYCDLCDKQYNRYSEYDNHLNSYDHHHRQRLKNLREYETGRKFGVRTTAAVDPNKQVTAKLIAKERAEMRTQRLTGDNPSFKPMGYRYSKGTSITAESIPFSDSIPIPSSNDAVMSALRKRNSEVIMESERKISEKKERLEKYGVKFQSAGHLATINDIITEGTTLSSYQSILLTGSNNKEGKTTNTQTKNKLNKNSTKYGGRFVTSSDITDQETNIDKERDKRMNALPSAKGRKSVTQLSSQTNVTNDDSESEREEEIGSVFGQRPLQPLKKSMVKPPMKKMCLKLSGDKYESYYH